MKPFMLPTLSSVSTTLNSNLLTSGPVQIKSKTFDIAELYSESFQTNSRGSTEFFTRHNRSPSSSVYTKKQCEKQVPEKKE